MAQLVASAAVTTCSFGVAPSTLNVLPTNRTTAGTPAANIMDSKPMVNIAPFGMCISLANPAVAAATAAALGGTDPHALHSQHACSLESGVAYCLNRRYARSEQHFAMPLHVGGCHSDCLSWAGYHDCGLKPTQAVRSDRLLGYVTEVSSRQLWRSRGVIALFIFFANAISLGLTNYFRSASAANELQLGNAAKLTR